MHLLKQVPSQIFCRFKQIICICLRRDLKKKKSGILPLWAKPGILSPLCGWVQDIPGNHTFLKWENETRNFLFPLFTASCPSPAEAPPGGREQLEQCRAPLGAFTAPQIPFGYWTWQRDIPFLKATEKRHLQPSFYTCRSSPSPAVPQHSPRQACFHKSCWLPSPTLTPKNDLCILSISNICPKSETPTSDFGEQHGFWDSLMLLKLSRPSSLLTTR